MGSQASTSQATSSGIDLEFRHFLGKALDAHRGGVEAWRCMSTGERVAVALALNRADWLASMDYTIVEAIQRAGVGWVSLLPAVCRAIESEGFKRP